MQLPKKTSSLSAHLAFEDLVLLIIDFIDALGGGGGAGRVLMGFFGMGGT